MISLRLPRELEIKLTEISQIEKTSKSSLIKKAIGQYIQEYEAQSSPFELGKDLFGKYGSGNSDLSRNYKSKLKDKLRAKHSH